MISLKDIEFLNEIESPSKLLSFCVKTGEKLGFQKSVYACPPPHRKYTHPDTIVRYHGINSSQFQRIIIDGLMSSGHLTTANSVLKARPFRWSDIAKFTADHASFQKLQDKMKIRKNGSGINDAWIFPLFGPQQRTGLAAFAKPNQERLLRRSVGDRLFVFAQMAHIRLCQLTPDLFELEKPLSRREMQIVAWAAAGKSNAEISAILDITESSIDSYMRRAFSKLEVHDRTSAAVKAISMEIVRT